MEIRGVKMNRTFVAIFLIFVLFGCSSKEIKPTLQDNLSKSIVAKEEIIDNESVVKKVISEGEYLELPKYDKSFKKVTEVKKVDEPEKFDVDKLVLPDKKIKLNIESMPVSDFIVYTLGDELGVPFLIDDQARQVKNPVNLRMPKELSSKEFLQVVVKLIEDNGLNVALKGGAIFITRKGFTPAPQISSKGIIVSDKGIDTSEVITQVIPLKYLRPNDVMNFIYDIFGRNFTMRPYLKDNTLLITAEGRLIKNIIEFLELLDLPYFRDRKPLLIEINYWKSDEFVKNLKEIFTNLSIPVANGPSDPGILLIPLKFMNSIIIISPDEQMEKFTLDWVKKLDNENAAGTEEKMYLYRPLYSKATDLVESFGKLYGAGGVVSKDSKSTQSQSQSQSVSAKDVKMAADDKRNILMISATPSNYKIALNILKELDKPSKQVLIETTIAEVTLKDDLKYGLEWFIKNRMNDGGYSVGTLGSLGVGGGSLTYQFLSDSQKFQSLISLFAQKNLINILSTPRIMVLDNEEASINVGTEVPIVTSETTSSNVPATGNSSGILRNIQYRTTGINLRVKPTVNTEGLLTLSLSQEVSTAQTNSTSKIDSPMILVRRINTVVVAPNGYTIVLGGIIDENKSETQTKVPLLGDIPILGHLFKNTSKGITKTELIIMMTPKILQTVDDLLRISNELKKELVWLKAGKI